MAAADWVATLVPCAQKHPLVRSSNAMTPKDHMSAMRPARQGPFVPAQVISGAVYSGVARPGVMLCSLRKSVPSSSASVFRDIRRQGGALRHPTCWPG